jgi:biotin transport system permease protein
MVSFSAGSLLFSVTTMAELRDSIGKAEIAIRSVPLAVFRKSKKKWAIALVHRMELDKLSRFSLGLSLMLGFLPRFFEIWEDSDVAYRARAGKKGITSLVLLIPLVTERMIEMAAETAAALESRGLFL